MTGAKKPAEHYERRFYSSIAETADGCWEWNGQRAERYGRFYAGDSGERWAHRIAYKMLVGPIPEHLEIDHLCRFTFCVNPEHMELVTPEENKRRALAAHEPAPHGTAARGKTCKCEPCRSAATKQRRAGVADRRRRFAAGELEAEHGRVETYRDLGCRCDECRSAASEDTKAWRRKRGTKPFKPAEHGSVSMYTNHGCRCEPCRKARSEYYRGWRQRRAAS